jgi:hypothetical protein
LSARGAVLGLAAAIFTLGCFLVTGGTDGYQRATQDAGGGTDDAGGLVLGCVSAADCTGDGGPQGSQICCLTPSPSSFVAACQPAPCGGSFSLQLCKTNAECGDASCTSQECTYSGSAVTLQACGSIPTCSPLTR